MAENTLDQRLKEHSATFASMVELLPAQLYLSKDESTDSQPTSKYWINKNKEKAPRQSVKEATRKAKRLRFDPEMQKSITQQRDEQTERLGNGLGEEEGEEEEEVEKELGEGGSGERRKPFSVENVKSASLDELQVKLKEKIDSFRQKRKVPDSLDSIEVAEKRLKRSEKKQRKKKLRLKQKTKKISSQSDKPKKPAVADKSGQLVFSKFDFTTQPTEEKEKKKKNLKWMLAKAEATQKKIEELKMNNEQKSEELREKLEWQKAVDLAKGVKRKDDPKLLKQTMKRIRNRKGKSRKDWEERAKHETEMRDKKQELRQKHIKERVEQVKAAKMKKMAKKRGLPRKPGF